MSWWISLERNGEAVSVPRFSDGGTYALGGSSEAELNVTYNYSPHYGNTIDPELGLRWINGKTGEECLPKLRDAVRVLGVERDPDYWAATPGNAGHALAVLAWWAALNPDAVFRVN